MAETSDLYTSEFYEERDTGSISSARTILPIVRDLCSPASVLDVGCGTGTWLSVWNELGVDDVFGVDGPHVDRAAVRIPNDRFRSADLEAPLEIDRRFDLAMSMEVAEHLSQGAADRLVGTLCSCADVVLFSAAIPGQLGTGHINAQPQSAWIAMFAKRGFGARDVIRPAVWHDDSVDYWYRQNVLLFVKGEPTAVVLDDVVHPLTFTETMSTMERGLPTIKESARELVGAVRRSVGRRVGRK